jgi:hypothetical protein
LKLELGQLPPAGLDRFAEQLETPAYLEHQCAVSRRETTGFPTIGLGATRVGNKNEERCAEEHGAGKKSSHAHRYSFRARRAIAYKRDADEIAAVELHERETSRERGPRYLNR